MRNETAAFDGSDDDLTSGETEASPTSEFTILFALWLLVFSASSQLMIVVAMLPAIGEQLAISTARQGLLVSSYAVMVGIFALVAGPISDKIGRRRMLLLGSGFDDGGARAARRRRRYFGLLAVRTLAGIAGGALSGAAVAYIGDYFPYERRGWANGWVMSGIAVGQIAGVPLGRATRRTVRLSHAIFDFRRHDGRDVSARFEIRAAAAGRGAR
jgi:predicted MFS family arabinose efflux permease